MAHFAKLDENNIVIYVTVGRDDDDENELSQITGDIYKKTSYNTHGGVHYDAVTNQPDGGEQLRKNFAGIGYYYDQSRDAFISPKPYDSWILDESTCLWNAPIAYPDDGNSYLWDEESVSWIKID
jgi:hypothetical protein